MTDTLATRHDVSGLDSRVGTRFAELEKRMDILFRENAAIRHGELADLERRMTVRLGGLTVAGIGVVSAVVKLL